MIKKFTRILCTNYTEWTQRFNEVLNSSCLSVRLHASYQEIFGVTQLIFYSDLQVKLSVFNTVRSWVLQAIMLARNSNRTSQNLKVTNSQVRDSEVSTPLTAGSVFEHQPIHQRPPQHIFPLPQKHCWRCSIGGIANRTPASTKVFDYQKELLRKQLRDTKLDQRTRLAATYVWDRV